MTAALVLVALALFVATSDDDLRLVPRHRTEREQQQISARRMDRATRARLSGAVAAVAVALVVAPPTGLLLAAGVALGVPVALGRLQSRSERDLLARRSQSVPLVLDLLAAAWRSGVPMLRAVESVAAATPPPLGRDLETVAGRLSLGADVDQAWSAMAWGDDAPTVHAALVAAGRSGASPVDVLHRSAQQARAARRRRGDAAARAVAVRVAAPLGLCFLPAFVLLAIAPAVLGAIGPALR